MTAVARRIGCNRPATRKKSTPVHAAPAAPAAPAPRTSALFDAAERRALATSPLERIAVEAAAIQRTRFSCILQSLRGPPRHLQIVQLPAAVLSWRHCFLSNTALLGLSARVEQSFFESLDICFNFGPQASHPHGRMYGGPSRQGDYHTRVLEYKSQRNTCMLAHRHVSAYNC